MWNWEWLNPQSNKASYWTAFKKAIIGAMILGYENEVNAVTHCNDAGIYQSLVTNDAVSLLMVSPKRCV